MWRSRFGETITSWPVCMEPTGVDWNLFTTLSDKHTHLRPDTLGLGWHNNFECGERKREKRSLINSCGKSDAVEGIEREIRLLATKRSRVPAIYLTRELSKAQQIAYVDRASINDQWLIKCNWLIRISLRLYTQTALINDVMRKCCNNAMCALLDARNEHDWCWDPWQCQTSDSDRLLIKLFIFICDEHEGGTRKSEGEGGEK